MTPTERTRFEAVMTSIRNHLAAQGADRQPAPAELTGPARAEISRYVDRVEHKLMLLDLDVAERLATAAKTLRGVDDQLTRQGVALEDRVTLRFSGLERRIEAHATTAHARIDSVDHASTAIDARLRGQIAALDAKLAALDAKLSRRIDQQLALLAAELARVARHVNLAPA